MTLETTKTITNLDLVIKKTENEINELMSVLEDLENTGYDVDNYISYFDEFLNRTIYEPQVSKKYEETCDLVKEKQDLLNSYYEIQEMEF